MVHFASLLGAAAILSSFALAAPVPDSAIGDEVAVSAPNGIIMSESVPPPAATSMAMAMAPPSAAMTTMAPPPAAMTTMSSMSSMPPSQPPSYNSPSQQSSSQQSSSYGNPSYGSGSSNWSPGYDNCVSQCMVTYGRPPSTYMPPTATSASGTMGTGATHVVIVAPTQGVLRYVPFAVNASVGDTIQFMWGANNHTVTKSSALLPCNVTADTPFTSGRQNKGFIFNQVVTTTDTTFFHCGVPTHCQKGMFGMINPPSAISSSTSVMNMIPAMAANNANVQAMVSYTNQKTGSNHQAANWGNSIDMSKLPNWAQQSVAENTMYTRTFLAANPEVLKSDGSINMRGTGSNPVMVPQDITAALNSAASPSSSASAAPSETAAATAASSAAAEASSTATAKSSAAQLASPRVLLAVTAVVVTFLAL